MARSALVTGGNRGIGRAIAAGLAAQGCRVIIGSRDEAAGRSAANVLGATCVPLDLTDPESIERAVQQAGDIDVLVNNAGVLQQGRMLDHSNAFAEAMAVMVHGPYHLMRLIAPGMVRRGYGRIVNVSSGWGAFSEGLGGPGAYGVAKAALNALTLAASQELPRTVNVNATCPGWVRTRMGGGAATRSPEEGADTALWLATLPDDGPTGGFFRDRQPIPW